MIKDLSTAGPWQVGSVALSNPFQNEPPSTQDLELAVVVLAVGTLARCLLDVAPCDEDADSFGTLDSVSHLTSEQRGRDFSEKAKGL